MTTTITKKVGSAGSGRDFSTLSAAIAAIPSSLVSVDQAWVLELYNDSDFVSGNITVSGITTDATRNILIRPAAGQAWRDNATSSTPLYPDQSLGVHLTQNSGSSGFFTINNDNVTVDGLQVDSSIFTLGAAIQHTGGANVVVKNNLLLGATTASGEGVVIGVGCKFVQNLIINISTGNGGLSLGGNTEFRNNTAVSPGSSSLFGMRGNYDAPLYLNNAVFSFAAAFSNTGNGSNDFNVSDGTAPGTHSLSSKTYANQFVSTTNDFRPKSGADLIGAGTPDATNTGGVDIRGQTRSGSTPTVGAMEFSSGGLTGALATTDGADVMAASGSLTATGTLAKTDGADTSAASGSLTSTGTLAKTDGADVLAGSGTVSTVGTLASNDGPDTIVASGSLSTAGTLATTDGADTSAIAASLTSIGTLSVTDGADTSVSSGSLTATGTLATTDGADVMSASGSIAGVISGSVAVTDGPDTMAAAAFLTSIGTLASTDGPDAIAAAAFLSALGSLATTDGADVIVASGSVGSVAAGTLATTDGPDVMTASGSLTSAGSLAVTDGADSMAGVGSLSTTGTINVTDGADICSATGSVLGVITGTINVTDGPDAIAAQGFIAGLINGALNFTDGPDRMSAFGTIGDISNNPIVCAHWTMKSRSATMALIGCPDD